MRHRRFATATALTALLAAGSLAGPVSRRAIAQDSAPESLLPPGFGEPAPAPSAAPSAPPAAPQSPPADLPVPQSSASPTPAASATPVDPALAAQYEMPAFARRSLATVGVAGTGDGGLAPDAFGDANGRWLEALMRRTSAPLPSRWLSIALRRALMSRVDTPQGVNGADFAAERAWLLLRMGESVAARSVVQSVDADRVTPKLRQVWMQAMLATGDPAGLCPLVPGAMGSGGGRDWTMAQVMCAGLSGASATVRPLLRAARSRRVASGIDLQLAEKVLGAGTDSQQAVTIEWDAVDQLTTWRFGLATATRAAVPEPLYATVGPQVTGWRALAPAIPLADRAGVAEQAAVMGVLSNAALVDLYSAIEEMDDAPGALSAVASDLRAAYAAADSGARRDALRQLWSGGGYARLILTARAAARVPATRDDADRDRLVAAMLSAGLDRTALRWRDEVPAGGDAWAMLTLADPDARGRSGYGAVTGYSGTGDATRKRALFFAGMAGLGRLSPADVERGAEALDVRIGAANAWTFALDRAVSAGQPGTVILLCAIGMQTKGWAGVPAASLYRIVAALRAAGLDGEARMIAAEAIARS